MRQDQLSDRSVHSASSAFVIMGTLWLLFAMALLLYQILNPPAVKVQWETATEVNTAGYFLYRNEGTFEADLVAVNDRLIPAEGSAVSGAAYTYVDYDVTPGHTYVYLLEEVEFDSSTNRFEEDMFSYTVPQTWWMIIASATSMVIGLALLITGLKENRNA